MGSTFNPQILVDKLTKLNSSQQSIETLSHWCIFHMNKAKQVVDTWDKQFRCSPREQRLAFLYLANDILQNSRRKGAEFVAEFWKVLPDSLRNVIENGDEFERNAALRLISIWEERKVFGSRGQILKEEFGKRQLDNGNKNWKTPGSKLRSPGGHLVDKLVSGYQAVYSSQMDDDAIFDKCRNAISFIQKVDKDSTADYRLDELKGKNVILRDCIEQLRVVESSRANLVSLLREALHEQEYKLEQVRDQLQAAQVHSEQASSVCRQLGGGNGNRQVAAEQDGNGRLSPHNYVPGAGEQIHSVIYTRQVPYTEKSEDPKSAAAAVAAKLAASTSSAQMLTYVLSSLASEGVIGSAMKESSSDYSSEKRAKIDNDHSYIPSSNTQGPLPSISYPEQLQHNLPVTQDLNPSEPPPPPPPPSSPPPLPPLPPPMQPTYPVPEYLHTAMPLPSMPYGYNINQPQPAPLPGYAPAVSPPVGGISTFAPPSNTYQSYPTEGGFYGQPSSLPMGRQ